jgi:hypothetical protein
MADLTEIREAIAAALVGVLPASQGKVSPWLLASPVPPLLQVMGPDEVDYDSGAFSADDADWDIIVQGFVGAASLRGAQERLDDWLAPSGDTSVRAKLEADQTLGGTAYGVVVRRASGYRLYTLPNQSDQVLGAEWLVHVATSG